MKLNGAKAAIAVAILGVGAATVALVVHNRSDSSRRPAKSQAESIVASARVPAAPPANHLAPAPPEPRFENPEQTVRYYGTLVEGERRALRAVEEALGKARGATGTEGTIGRLEDMRADYQERIRRHEAKLKH
jgi:hypothetical protein